jgi:hypothetical protein
MDVWDPSEQSLGIRASAQILEQLEDRFPDAVDVWLVGDMTGHYYTDESDVDLLVRTEPDDLPAYRKEAVLVNGYKLIGTEHKVNFYLVSTETDPAPATSSPVLMRSSAT